MKKKFIIDSTFDDEGSSLFLKEKREALKEMELNDEINDDEFKLGNKIFENPINNFVYDLHKNGSNKIIRKKRVITSFLREKNREEFIQKMKLKNLMNKLQENISFEQINEKYEYEQYKTQEKLKNNKILNLTVINPDKEGLINYLKSLSNHK